jgi:2-aminoadipate transaminase
MSELNGQYTTNWHAVLAERTRDMRSSIIRELLKITERSGVISFAGGLPAPELFPVREFLEACSYVLAHEAQCALQYGQTQGYGPLLDFLAEKGRKYGVPSLAENILVTNGSQQALDLIGKVFIDPGDIIVSESPTYLGAIQAFQAYGPRFVTVPLDDDGMQVELLEDTLLHQHAKFIYVLPNFQNPAGTTMSMERRQALVRIAARHGAFIVEDDPYGELRFEGEDIPPIVSLHKENVIYLSTFSKTLAPGIRLGWISAPKDTIAKLVQAKQGADLHTGTLVQCIVNDICQRGILKSHVRQLRTEYRKRRDVMLAAMAQYFPDGVTWTRPQGGLFLWVRLPDRVDTEKLFHIALDEQVAFVPGSAFFPDNAGHNAMRLNFSCMDTVLIEEGIRRLGRAITRELDRPT